MAKAVLRASTSIKKKRPKASKLVVGLLLINMALSSSILLKLFGVL